MTAKRPHCQLQHQLVHDSVHSQAVVAAPRRPLRLQKRPKERNGPSNGKSHLYDVKRSDCQRQRQRLKSQRLEHQLVDNAVLVMAAVVMAAVVMAVMAAVVMAAVAVAPRRPLRLQQAVNEELWTTYSTTDSGLPS